MASERHKPKKVQMICGNCGSTDVSRDAWSGWDVGLQQWVLGAVFDYGHCHNCDGKTHILEVTLD